MAEFSLVKDTDFYKLPPDEQDKESGGSGNIAYIPSNKHHILRKDQLGSMESLYLDGIYSTLMRRIFSASLYHWL